MADAEKPAHSLTRPPILPPPEPACRPRLASAAYACRPHECLFYGILSAAKHGCTRHEPWPRPSKTELLGRPKLSQFYPLKFQQSHNKYAVKTVRCRIGTTTFSGTIGQNALAGDGVTDFSYSHAVVLAPGTSVVFAANSESSNFGGYGGATGTTQNGIEIFLNGIFNGTEAVALSVFDKDVHSGVPRVNPFGEVVDSYVLQGRDSLGRDTGDDFEVSQAPGQFRFIERVSTVPKPSTLALFALSCIGLGWHASSLNRESYLK